MAENNNWKIVAIVFMVLFVLETILLISAIFSANKDIDKENKCIINICGDYESYYYEDFSGICSCYDQNGELAHQEYLSEK